MRLLPAGQTKISFHSIAPTSFCSQCFISNSRDESPLKVQCRDALRQFASTAGLRALTFTECGVSPDTIDTVLQMEQNRAVVACRFVVPTVRDADTLKYLCHSFSTIHGMALRPGAVMEITNNHELEMPSCADAFKESEICSYVVNTEAVIVDETFITLQYKARHRCEDGPVHLWGTAVSRLVFPSSTIDQQKSGE